MRLSDAIRLGAMASEQGFGTIWDHGKTCALGAAYLAAGLFNRDHCVARGAASRTFPVIDVSIEQCPVYGGTVVRCFHGPKDVVNVITHLNDIHEWTREQIADWVATVEPPDVPAPATAEPASISAVDPVDGLVAMVHAR